MSSSTGGRRADAVRNRALALEGAKQLLAEPGAALTVEAIAARSGLGAGTVVRSFGSKEALLDAAVAELLEPVVNRARQLAGAPDEDSLRALLSELTAFQQQHYGIDAQLAGLSLPQTTAQEAALHGALHDLLAAGQEAGRIRDDVPLDTAAALIVGAAHAVARASVPQPGMGEAFVLIVTDGLRP